MMIPQHPNRVGTHRAPCPSCDKGRTDDALAITVKADGARLWICHRCGAKGASGGGRMRSACRAAADWQAPLQSSPPSDPADKTARARKICREARPAAGTLVQRYLASRGLHDTPRAIGYHPEVWHWPSQQRLPAMVCPMVPVTATDNAEPQAAHLTFLASDGGGKANVDKPRLYLGPIKGAVIKLTPDEDVEMGLAIAEGAETALSAMALGYPTWATTCSETLAQFPVLAGVECLSIFADHDKPNPKTGRRAGQHAAAECAERWRSAGREVEVILPEEEGADWNDRLCGGQRHAG